MVQWSVQSIAALGLKKTQILSYLWLVWAGSSGGLPPFTASKIVQ